MKVVPVTQPLLAVQEQRSHWLRPTENSTGRSACVTHTEYPYPCGGSKHLLTQNLLPGLSAKSRFRLWWRASSCSEEWINLPRLRRFFTPHLINSTPRN